MRAWLARSILDESSICFHARDRSREHNRSTIAILTANYNRSSVRMSDGPIADVTKASFGPFIHPTRDPGLVKHETIYLVDAQTGNVCFSIITERLRKPVVLTLRCPTPSNLSVNRISMRGP